MAAVVPVVVYSLSPRRYALHENGRQLPLESKVASAVGNLVAVSGLVPCLDLEAAPRGAGRYVLTDNCHQPKLTY